MTTSTLGLVHVLIQISKLYFSWTYRLKENRFLIPRVKTNFWEKISNIAIIFWNIRLTFVDVYSNKSRGLHFTFILIFTKWTCLNMLYSVNCWIPPTGLIICMCCCFICQCKIESNLSDYSFYLLIYILYEHNLYEKGLNRIWCLFLRYHECNQIIIFLCSFS